jgi:hypothetical protein
MLTLEIIDRVLLGNPERGDSGGRAGVLRLPVQSNSKLAAFLLLCFIWEPMFLLLCGERVFSSYYASGLFLRRATH